MVKGFKISDTNTHTHVHAHSISVVVVVMVIKILETAVALAFMGNSAKGYLFGWKIYFFWETQ